MVFSECDTICVSKCDFLKMLYHNPPLYIYTVDHYCGFLNVALIMMVDYRLYHTLHMCKYTFWDVMKKKKILKMISIWFRHFHSLNKVIKSGFEKEMRSRLFFSLLFFFFMKRGMRCVSLMK